MAKIPQIYVLKATYNYFEKLTIPYRITRFLKDVTVNIDYAVAILTGVEILGRRTPKTKAIFFVFGVRRPRISTPVRMATA